MERRIHVDEQPLPSAWSAVRLVVATSFLAVALDASAQAPSPQRPAHLEAYFADADADLARPPGAELPTPPALEKEVASAEQTGERIRSAALAGSDALPEAARAALRTAELTTLDR